MKKKYLLFKNLLLAIFFVGLSGKAFAQDRGDNTGIVKVGEEVFQSYESPHPYVAISSTDKTLVWTQSVKYEGASYISLHFSKLQLAPDDFLLIRSVDGERSWKYYNKGNYNQHDPSQGFWSIPIYGNEVIIEIHSVNRQQEFGYVIDKFARGFTDEEMNATTENEEAICGNDDSREAKCYQTSESVAYGHSRAVARLMINGTGACTGWLIGDEGHLMTNNHCVGSVSDANNVTVEFMAEGASCATNCQSWFGCPGTIEASSTTLVRTDANLDYSLLALPSNVSGTYGFLQLRETGAAVGERIYIPQHPQGWGKRIAIDSDHPDDAADGFAHVQTIDEPRCGGTGDDVGYYADTQGGSSGSPVIGYSDHLVVALHHCAYCPNRGVPIEEIITDLGDDLPNNSLPNDCNPDELVIFHFEHENGTEDTVFNLCEDVYLDGSATTNTGTYFMDIWRYNGPGVAPTWLSGQDPDPGLTGSWRYGSPTLINVTQTFVNDSNHPVTFQAGETYEVKIAISHPDCGWVSVTNRFTYGEGQMSSGFNIVDYNCHDGEFDVTVTALDSAPSQWWRVYETSVQGSTADANTIGGVTGIQSGTTVTFTNLDPTKFYYIKHGVWTNNCPWQETRKPLTPNCCENFGTADFDLGIDFSYNFWVGNYNGYTDIGATHEWYILSSPNATGGPYTPVFSTSTTGGSNFPLFTNAQFGVYYTVVHKVVSYCGEICYAQVQYQKEGEVLLAQANAAVAAEVDCCLVFDFWPNGPGQPEEFTAEFDIGIDPQTGTIQTFVPNTYPNNPNITHEWTLYSSPNETGGPYTLVDEGTGINYSYSTAQDGIYYFLFHKAISECGEVCYAQTICRNCGEQKKDETFSGVVDCALIDEIKDSICDVPVNLSYNCHTAKLNWEDIPSATGYIVEIYWDDPSCCETIKDPVRDPLKNSPIQQWNVTDSNFQLPYINISGCFSWRIGVECKDETLWSDKKCSSCITPHDPHEPQGPQGPADTAGTAARISPNPNDGNMNIQVTGEDKTDFTLKVYRFDGVLIKTFDNNRIENGSVDINWNGKSLLSPGMYFFVITTDKESITKKVVIK